MLSYVLVTPAHNEEAFIEKTIQSMIAQTHLPIKWVIVSDASTDRTDEIIQKYQEQYGWISYLRMPEGRSRQFAAKVECFNAGYDLLKEEDFDIIGNLDADLSFDPEYFWFLLDKFERDQSLGVAGTPFVEESGYSSAENSFEGYRHVAGACQLFSRECFEEIGGYVPVKSRWNRLDRGNHSSNEGLEKHDLLEKNLSFIIEKSVQQRKIFFLRTLPTGGKTIFLAAIQFGRYLESLTSLCKDRIWLLEPRSVRVIFGPL